MLYLLRGRVGVGTVWKIDQTLRREGERRGRGGGGGGRGKERGERREERGGRREIKAIEIYQQSHWPIRVRLLQPELHRRGA